MDAHMASFSFVGLFFCRVNLPQLPGKVSPAFQLSTYPASRQKLTRPHCFTRSSRIDSRKNSLRRGDRDYRGGRRLLRVILYCRYVMKVVF